MKKDLISLALVSTVVLASIAGGQVAKAQTSQEVDSNSVVEFRPPGPTDPGTPVDPEDPDPLPIDPDPEIKPPVIYPGGPLRFNHVPSISFGINKLSSGTATYFARLEKVVDIATGTISPKGSFIEVEDLTGKLQGWDVKVSGDGIFKSDKGDVKGIITLKDPAVRGVEGMETKPEKAPLAQQTVVIGDVAGTVDVMAASEGNGYNKWQVRYGHSDTTIEGDDATRRNPNISLTVPRGQLILTDETYISNLVWTLEQGI